MALWRRVLAVVVVGSGSVLSSSLLSGCGNFFSCEGKTSCGGGTTTVTNTGDFVYVSNSPSGNTYVSEYTLASGTLTAVTGASEINLGYTPVAMVVSPDNGYLYVASAGGYSSPGVYVYTISSTGALTAGNGGKAFYTDAGIASMDISPDGGYLFTVGTPANSNITTLSEYTIDKATGLPTAGIPVTTQTPLTSCALVIGNNPLSQQCTIKVSPGGNYVAVALGAYGIEVFPYSSSLGITLTPQVLVSGSSDSADFSLACDDSNYLYVASTFALTSFASDAGGSVPVQTQSVPFDTSSGIKLRAVTISPKFTNLYAADEAHGTIYEYTLPGSGALTALGTQAGPTSVSALGVDNSGSYLVAAGYDANQGVQVFSIGSTGTLSPVGTNVGTGADDTLAPTVIALSH